MKKPIVKSFIYRLKKKFVFDPERYVSRMSEKKYSPYGKRIEKVAKAIVNSRDISPKNKAKLLLDAYGKYYKYYFDKQVLAFTYSPDFSAYAAFGRIGFGLFSDDSSATYEELVKQNKEELQYSTLRDLKMNMAKVIGQMSEEAKENGEILQVPDEIARYVGIMKVLGEGNFKDFSARTKEEIYKREKYVRDTLVVRVEQQEMKNSDQEQ